MIIYIDVSLKIVLYCFKKKLLLYFASFIRPSQKQAANIPAKKLFLI